MFGRDRQKSQRPNGEQKVKYFQSNGYSLQNIQRRAEMGNALVTLFTVRDKDEIKGKSKEI